MSIIGDVHIKVSTEVLNEKAQAVSKSISDMANCFERLEMIVNRTSYYWIGEAGDLHRKMYRDQKENVEEMIKRLKEHPRDLTAIAQNYQAVDAKVTQMANVLSGDVIE